MINISIEQALTIIHSLKLQNEIALSTISEFEKYDDKVKILSHQNKVSMIINDLKYKLNNEISHK